MELTVHLEENVDIPFITKLLTQIKGIKSVEFSEEQMPDSEYDEKFLELLEKSRVQFKEGKFTAHSDELINSFFK